MAVGGGLRFKRSMLLVEGGGGFENKSLGTALSVMALAHLTVKRARRSWHRACETAPA